MPSRLWSESDGIEYKALNFLKKGSIKIDNITDDEFVADVLRDEEDPDTSKASYIVVVRKDGTHLCDCLNISYAKKDLHHFWGNQSILITPECSHILAVKHHPLYLQWLDPTFDVKTSQYYMKGYVRNTHIKNLPVDLESLHPEKRRRKINFTELIRSKDGDAP